MGGGDRLGVRYATTPYNSQMRMNVDRGVGIRFTPVPRTRSGLVCGREQRSPQRRERRVSLREKIVIERHVGIFGILISSRVSESVNRFRQRTVWV